MIKSILQEKTAKKSSSSLRVQILSGTIIWAIPIIYIAMTAGCQRQKAQTEPPRHEPNWVQTTPTYSNETPETNNIAEPTPEPNETPMAPIIEMIRLVTSDKAGPNKPPIIPFEANEPNIPEPEPPKTTEPNLVIPEPPVTEANEPNTAQADGTPTENTVAKKDARDFHNKFSHIFSRYVDKNGLVKYSKLRRIQFELTNLQRNFANLDSKEYNSWTQNDKIAMWINAWNMQILRILVDYYPVEDYRYPLIVYWPADSIRHINKRLGDSIDGIKRQKITIMGEEFTLKSLQDEILPKYFNEPKVFLAISQGCLGGPPLRQEPYYGYKLQQQLEEQIGKFVKQKGTFDINIKNKTVTISAIFEPKEMYGNDFKNKYGTDKKFKDQKPLIGAILNFLTPYLNPQQREFLEKEIFKVNFKIFNWKINDSPEK